MTSDNTQEVVQPDVVPEGTPSPGVVAPPEPSPEEKLVALKEQIDKAVAESVAQATEAAKREIQSAKDSGRAEVEKATRRAKLAENVLGTTRQRLQESDPEVAKELELSELRAREANRIALEQGEAQRRQQEALGVALQDSLKAHLEALGVDPEDKRIDWAVDSSDYVQGRSRFDASVAKIVKEERQTMENSLEARLKDLEAKVSQANIEANSVSAGTPSGVVAGSDAEFVQKFGSGELPLTKENVERYNKITNTY